MTQTAILGAGVMGETLLSGLVRAGRRVDHLLVGEKRPERARELEERYGVAVVVATSRPPRKADTLALVVKPQDMGDLLDEIAPVLRPGQLVVSLAAGITTAFIESRVPEGVAVVRVMPNTPALVDEGMAAISPGSHCDEAHLAEAEALMASTGKVLRIPERQQDAVTAISGSGPAYIFFVVESMIEAGVHLGLPRATATELVVQTARRLGQDAARDRRPTRPCCASRSPRRAAPPPRRCASSRSTRCARRSWPRWRPPATAPARSPRAWTRPPSSTRSTTKRGRARPGRPRSPAVGAVAGARRRPRDGVRAEHRARPERAAHRTPPYDGPRAGRAPRRPARRRTPAPARRRAAPAAATGPSGRARPRRTSSWPRSCPSGSWHPNAQSTAT